MKQAQGPPRLRLELGWGLRSRPGKGLRVRPGQGQRVRQRKGLLLGRGLALLHKVHLLFLLPLHLLRLLRPLQPCLPRPVLGLLPPPLAHSPSCTAAWLRSAAAPPCPPRRRCRTFSGSGGWAYLGALQGRTLGLQSLPCGLRASLPPPLRC